MSHNVMLRSSAISVALVCAVTGGTLAATSASAAPAPVPATATVSAAASDNDHGSNGQGPVTPVDPSRQEAAEQGIQALAPKITRSQVTARAKAWVGIGLDYDWGGSYQGYRTDCSGYVSMAWKLDASLTTDTFGPRGVTEGIGKSELKPGDALLNKASGASGHVVLFEKWSDSDHSTYMGYEFTSSGVHHREIPYPYYSGYGTFVPVRNKSVVEDGPADPGMTELAAGEFSGGGKNDLLAVQVSTGKLFMYPNTGRSGLDMLGPRVEIGTGGWNGMKNLTVGDYNTDGKDDLIATKTETGELFVYPGTGRTGLNTLGTRTLIGTGGWNGMKNLFSGDFNADGKTDLG
ncbi:FG-GAP-like repeat-containing protein, partial [Streptomyces sp. NPDC095613]|uniref:C40 family peptidase n=1 Tax=Streptomyces sp. NPDC095613 TaxID=3155540 RepID=UPI003332F08A